MSRPRPADRTRRGQTRGAVAWLAALALLVVAGCGPAGPAAPARPEGPALPKLTTWAVDGEIHLSWRPTQFAAVYNLYWSQERDVASDPEGVIENIRGERYVHKGLANGEPYYYYLVALNARGEEIQRYAPVGDIPYNYEARRHRNFLAVIPRVHDTFDSLAGQYLQDPDKGWLIRDFNEQRQVQPFEPVLIPLKPYEPGGLTDKGYRTVPVLVYHQLSPTKSNKMSVRRQDFELQMAYLKRNRYQVITMDQFVDFLRFEGQVPERAVVITFDDGWATVYDIALPILRKHGFKATLFLTTDLVGSNKQALTWQQVKALEASGVVDVQCHTKTHTNLADPGDRDLKAYLDYLDTELRGARETLKKRLDKECRYLAYPYGATNHLVVAVAQQAGYRAAFTVDRGANPFFVTNYRVLRSMVYGDFGLKQFAANLESFSDRVLQ